MATTESVKELAVQPENQSPPCVQVRLRPVALQDAQIADVLPNRSPDAGLQGKARGVGPRSMQQTCDDPSPLTTQISCRLQRCHVSTRQDAGPVNFIASLAPA